MESAAFFAFYNLAVSKPDLKHSGTFFRKFACDIGFAADQIFCPKGPCGHIQGALLQNIQKKIPCGHIKGAPLQNIQKRGPCGHTKGALLQNIQQKKAPAGIFSEPF